MRAFGIGLPLAAELRRGHWNVLLWARLGDACLLSQPPVSGPRPAIPAGVTNSAIRAYSMCASPRRTLTHSLTHIHTRAHREHRVWCDIAARFRHQIQTIFSEQVVGTGKLAGKLLSKNSRAGLLACFQIISPEGRSTEEGHIFYRHRTALLGQVDSDSDPDSDSDRKRDG